MDRFIVEGGHPLTGSITPAGNKNAALAILPACLLTDEEITVRNVPQIGDVLDMIEILADLGVDVRNTGDHEVTLRAQEVKKTELRPDLSHRIRGSLTLAGPMLARCGLVKLPYPGGDRIGRRPVDTHFLALEGLGATIEVEGNHYDMRAEGLIGDDIFLDEASVTATESTVMAAVLAKGTTVLRNTASEPHVQQLCRFLVSLGAKISGIGTNLLTVEGVDGLTGGTCELEADYMEVGSFIGLGAVTEGEITIRNAATEHLRMILRVFRRLGVDVEVRGQDLFVPAGQQLNVLSDVHNAIPKIDDAPWPGFPADLISIAIVVASQAAGTVLIFEKMFETRLFFVDRLISMGARIVLCDPHRVVVAGPSRLHGETLVSPDIRAGMALLIASLCAKDRSTIQNIRQIDRGYERIDDRLRALGARIERL